MKTALFIIVSIIISVSLSAQTGSKIVQTIKGKVVDAASNRPISYTNIGIEGTFYGTASDSTGNFELKIPEEMAEKNIYFSAVGFDNDVFPVKALFSKTFNIVKLESKSYGIDNIDVAAQNKVLIRILKMASENIPYNYAMGPYNLHCSYLNKITIDDTIQKTAEANVLLFDRTGYTQPSKLNEFQNRKYAVDKKTGDEDYRFSAVLIYLDELLELDWVRSSSAVLSQGIVADYELKLESQPTINGKEHWVIVFSMPEPTPGGSGDFYASSFNGKITINKQDYSVLKIEGKVISPKNNRQGKSLAVGNSNSDYFKDVSYDFAVTYKNLLPESIRLNKNYSYKGQQVNTEVSLQVNKFQSSKLLELESRDYFPGE